ncbi:acyl-CoA N-acyltransferase [Geopyxis carbonaria]|nr:acyl-CoA N-acyltransferase [Geopyxis carbonaria]
MAPLFPATLISPDVLSALPAGYTLRPLERSDYSAGFLDVLRVLTSVGDITQADWEARFDWMAARAEEYFVVVIADTNTGAIVGVGSLVIERKFLRNLGAVGHIEDISVASEMQGKKFGLRLIQALDFIAQKVGCYKAILDCSEANRGFYEKCGYKVAGVQMSHYYDGSKPKDAPKEA